MFRLLAFFHEPSTEQRFVLRLASTHASKLISVPFARVEILRAHHSDDVFGEVQPRWQEQIQDIIIISMSKASIELI
jgi:hypothetical protein